MNLGALEGSGFTADELRMIAEAAAEDERQAAYARECPHAFAMYVRARERHARLLSDIQCAMMWSDAFDADSEQELYTKRVVENFRTVVREYAIAMRQFHKWLCVHVPTTVVVPR